MNQKTRYRSAPLNCLVIVICLAVCGFSLWLFWKDLNRSTVRSDSKQIATISFKYKIAQRKFNDRVVWERLQSNSPLYNGDTVRTADLAQATIHFNNGTQLEVNENTMLQIFYSEDGSLRVSVNDGNVSVDTTASKESVALEMSGISVNLDSGSKVAVKTAPVTYTQSESKGAASTNSEINQLKPKASASIQVMAGNAVVQNEKGEAEEIKKDETVKVEADGKVARKPVSVSLPPDYRILNFESEKACDVKMELSVPEKETGRKVIIQTSRTKDFAEVENTVTAENVESAEIPAGVGVTYWRVAPEDDAENFTEGKIVVQNVPGVTGKTPADGDQFFYRSELPGINFGWNGNEYAVKYRLEISGSADFSSDVVNTEVSGQSTVLKNLTAGKYWWRVTPFYSVNDMGWSGTTEATAFTVTKRDSYKAPELTVPVEGGKFIYDGDSFDASFAWKTDVPEAETKVIVAKDSEFKNVVQNLNSPKKRLEEKFAVSELGEGTYYWKVTQKFTDDIDGSAKYLESAARSFAVQKYVPEKSRLIYPKNGFTVEDDEIADLNFMWKTGDGETEKVVVQVSASSDFKNIAVEKNVSPDEFEIKNLKLKEGTYFWRVKTERNRMDGSKEVQFTESWSFTVLGKLAAPEILLPESGREKVVQEGAKLAVSWKAVPGADYYKVILTDSETGKVVDSTIAAGMETVELSSGLDIEEKRTKNLKLSVQSFANETAFSALRTGGTAEETFSLRNPEHIALSGPEDNFKIAGLTALRQETKFSWTPGIDVPETYQFTLWKKSEGGALSVVSQQKSAKTGAKVSRLTEGNYFWTVEASLKDGVKLDAVKGRAFTVSPVPLLPAAVLVNPGTKGVVGPKYLKSNRAIIFEWNKVEGATDYTFELFQKLENGKYRKIYSETKFRGNSIKYKKLNTLDVGQFEWQVRAFSHAKDGYEEQKGRLAAATFNIQFTEPKSVQTVDPGIMYGE